MRLLPRTRRWRIIGAVAVAVVLLTSPLWWGPLLFGAKLVVPGPAYSRAESRTSPAAPVVDAPLPPPARAASDPTGTKPAIARETIVALDSPSAVADPPGPGPVLVTTLDGQVHAVDLARGTAEVVLDLSDRVSTGGERGLLGIAVDPPAERVHLAYTASNGDVEIWSWPLVDGLPDRSDDGVLHLEIGQPFENHNGGNLVFGPDGLLWIGTGDGGGAGDRGEVAQRPDRLLGKMLRVVPDPAGGVMAPATNPDWDGGRPEVWAIGLRNPWRYSFDRVTNRLWIADVGQNTIEEVSVADPDAAFPNFGWDDLEGTNDYEGSPDERFTDPVVEYDHDEGCSITGGYVYRGEQIPALTGWYLFADFCGGWIRAVPADAATRHPVELLSGVGSVISFGELEDGELLVLTTDTVSRLTPP